MRAACENVMVTVTGGGESVATATSVRQFTDITITTESMFSNCMARRRHWWNVYR